MSGAAHGPNLHDKEFTIIDPSREIATQESMVAQSRTTERLPALLAERFRPERSYVLPMTRNPRDRTGVQDGEAVATRADAEPCDGKFVVARLDNQVTLKRYRRVDDHTIELCPESHNEAHAVRRVHLAKDELHIDGYVVGALIGGALSCADATASAA